MTLMTSPTEMMPTSCTLADHRDLGDPPLAHLAHDVVDVVVDVAGDRVGGHDLGDPQPAEALAAVVDQPQDVALGEDADQPTLLIHDRQ